MSVSSKIDKETLSGPGLLYYEQNVNNRYKAAAAPKIDKHLLPEAQAAIPLAWVRLPKSEVDVRTSTEYCERELTAELGIENDFLMPVHPLDEKAVGKENLIYSGTIQFTASYRTAAYQPQTGGPFADTIPDGHLLMIKLHLEQPLPGIAGDRRLPKDRIEKCVLFGDAISAGISDDGFGAQLKIVKEFFGVSHPSRGVLFRMLPAQGIYPLFSLFSPDPAFPDEPPLLVQKLQEIYGNDRMLAARHIGKELAKPLVTALAAGFRLGFSLEMHAQNTLVSLGSDTLIKRVFFRDLEGVIFSSKLRRQLGLTDLFEGATNPEILCQEDSLQRLYNRNFDHDLGRVFDGSIEALRNAGYFDDRLCRIAIESVRREARQIMKAANLRFMHKKGRFLPLSRAPWGNGLRLGHYFRSKYR